MSDNPTKDQCFACEGEPKAGNDPCVVCGRATIASVSLPQGDEVALNQGPRQADGVGSNPDLRAQGRQGSESSNSSAPESTAVGANSKAPQSSNGMSLSDAELSAVFEDFKELQKRARKYAEGKIAEDVGFTGAHRLALVIGYEAGWGARSCEDSSYRDELSEGTK